jgi:hypothetical protein
MDVSQLLSLNYSIEGASKSTRVKVLVLLIREPDYVEIPPPPTILGSLDLEQKSASSDRKISLFS